MATPSTMIAGTRRTTSVAVAGGAIRKANTRRFPTVPNDATIATASSASSTSVGEAGAEAEQPGLALVERADEQRAVQHDVTPTHGDHRGDDLAARGRRSRRR